MKSFIKEYGKLGACVLLCCKWIKAGKEPDFLRIHFGAMIQQGYISPNDCTLYYKLTEKGEAMAEAIYNSLTHLSTPQETTHYEVKRL